MPRRPRRRPTLSIERGAGLDARSEAIRELVAADLLDQDTDRAALALAEQGLVAQTRQDRGAPVGPAPDIRSRYRVDRERMTVAIDPSATFEEWAQIARAMVEGAKRALWLAADVILEGERRFGERASALLDDSPWATETLLKAIWTAERIPPERRRDGIPMRTYQAIASLDVPDQELLLDRVESEGLNSDEARVEARTIRRRRERERAEALPPPVLDFGPSFSVQRADALDLPLPDGSVGLIVTSPPYALEKAYRGGDVGADAWVAFIEAFCREAFRVLDGRGRLVLNVPIDTTLGAPEGSSRPTSAQATAAALAAGFAYKATLIWHDGDVSRQVARGSVDSCTAPHPITPAEHLLVFHKGRWGRPVEGRTTDLGHEEWLEWTNGYWPIRAEGQPWEGFEAAYPIEIPQRLIKLFSYREDVVCDPFVGSGTTALAAYKLGRAFRGFDLDAVQVASTLRRLAVARGAVADLRVRTVG